MRKPSYGELVDFARKAQKKQPEALEIMQRHNLVLDDLNDPMQKLAFAFYTDLVELERDVRWLFDEE